MSIMSSVTITPSERATYVNKLNELIGARKPEDVLWILIAGIASLVEGKWLTVPKLCRQK